MNTRTDSPLTKNVSVISTRKGISTPRQNVSTLSTVSAIPQTFCQRLFSWRSSIALQLHFSLVLFTMMRMNMSIALVCMLDTTPANQSEPGYRAATSLNGSVSEVPFVRNDNETEAVITANTETTKGEFQWESSIQGLLLSSSSMLGFILPLAADKLTRMVGGKSLLLFCLALPGVLTLLHPVAARLSPYILFALRLVSGLVTGMIMPLIGETLSWWSPDRDKVTLISFVFSGINIGNILNGVTSAYLCVIPVDNGWPFIFYVQGALCLVWCIVWQICGATRPEDHKFVSGEEIKYIIKTRRGLKKNQKRTSPPYRAILTSPPVWAYLGVLACHTFNIMILFSYIPFYLKSVFNTSVEDIGVVTSVAYVLRFAGVLFWGQLSDQLANRTKLTTTVCRKIPQCAGVYLAAVSAVVLAFTRTLIPGLVMLAVVMISHCVSAAVAIVMPLDMAPKYAGFLTALFSSTSTLVGMSSPIIVSMMTTQGSLEEWRNVYLLVAAVFFIGATWFLLFASSKLQSWADVKDERGRREKKKEGVEGLDFTFRRRSVVDIAPSESPADAGPIRSAVSTTSKSPAKRPVLARRISSCDILGSALVWNEHSSSGSEESAVDVLRKSPLEATIHEVGEAEESSSSPTTKINCVTSGVENGHRPAPDNDPQNLGHTNPAFEEDLGSDARGDQKLDTGETSPNENRDRNNHNVYVTAEIEQSKEKFTILSEGLPELKPFPVLMDSSCINLGERSYADDVEMNDEVDPKPGGFTQPVPGRKEDKVCTPDGKDVTEAILEKKADFVEHVPESKSDEAAATKREGCNACVESEVETSGARTEKIAVNELGDTSSVRSVILEQTRL